MKMKCANCGNKNPKTLWDEGDTFYCSICCHRTQTATGKDDLITCPYCGRFRDRKAACCMWCNNTIGSNATTRKEFKDLDSVLKQFEKRLDKSNLRYGKLLGKKKNK